MNQANLFAIPAARYAAGPSLHGGACVTAHERQLAENACEEGVLRGVGQHYQQAQAYAEDTRWRDVDPCLVKTLPSCPCATQDDIAPIAGCFTGTPPSDWGADYHNQWCGQVGAGLMLSDWCPGVPPPPVPPCLESRDGVDYCNQYGFGGSNPGANALCWLSIKGNTLGTLTETPLCQTSGGPVPGIPPSIPTTDTTTGGRTQRSGMMLPGLILLAVLGGGVAYYVAQRRKS
jgi:hypothetical protein